MGRQKLLMPFGEGTILHRTLKAVSEAGFEKIFAVVSRETKDLLFPMPEGVEYVVNPDPDRGKDSSFYCGLEALNREEEEKKEEEGERKREGRPAFAVFLGDKPMITAEQIRDLRSRFETASQSALIPRKDGAPGHPAFYSPLWIERFLRSGKGARETLFRHAHEVQWAEGYESCFFDVDTEEDYRRLLRGAGTSGFDSEAESGENST
jgi:molybdenum cofactor cytidylyltransferase